MAHPQLQHPIRMPPPGQAGVPPQMLMQLPTDPIIQEAIDADFHPLNLKLGPPDNTVVLSAFNDQEIDAENDLDLTGLNRLTKLLVTNPNIRCPPPPNVVSQKLSAAINNTKEEGNTLFKAKQFEKAIQRYTMAASIAVQRPPWEMNQVMREELSTILSNRSAAFLEAGDFISALVDAEIVIQIKRPWSKGHFRKAKALMALQEYLEAKEAIILGLQFDPKNAEMNGYLAEIENIIAAQAPMTC